MEQAKAIEEIESLTARTRGLARQVEEYSTEAATTKKTLSSECISIHLWVLPLS